MKKVKDINSKYKHKLMVKEIKLWELQVPLIMNHIDQKTLNILDVGAAEGNALLAFYNHKILKQGFLADINWNRYQEEFLAIHNKEDKYYVNKNIKIFPMDGLDSRIPFDDAELVIMTYNNGVSWKDLYPKVSKAKYIISDDSWNDHLLKQTTELEVIYKFNLHPTSAYSKMWLEARNSDDKPYHLFKRISNID